MTQEMLIAEAARRLAVGDAQRIIDITARLSRDNIPDPGELENPVVAKIKEANIRRAINYLMVASHARRLG